MHTIFAVGLVGSLGVGKGAVADYLIKEYGFVSFSLSYIVHEEYKKRGISKEKTRELLQNIGDELRKKEGEGVLAKRALEYLRQEGSTKIIIEGIRHPGEIEVLRKLDNFFLIAVDASVELRYRRVIERAKPWDPTDWDGFVKVNSRDTQDTQNKLGQQVGACMQCADFTIQNNSDLKHLYEKIEAVIAKSVRNYPAFQRCFGNMTDSSARS